VVSMSTRAALRAALACTAAAFSAQHVCGVLNEYTITNGHVRHLDERLY
jgi:hypothetical protein